MITLYEIAERTQLGDKILEQNWDKKFFLTITDLVKKYEIIIPKK